jgi:hypothetical protein
VGAVESLLSEARAAIDALDAEGAERALAEATRRLEATPPPQAAWLMAEVHRLDAERLAETDPHAARAALTRAIELGGPRAPSLDLQASGAPPLLEPAGAPVRLLGLGSSDRLFVDGVERQPSRLPSGRHHVRVLRREREIYSRWVQLTAPTTSVRLRTPPPCSDADLAGARIEGGRAAGAEGTHCPNWVLARPAGDAVEIARCRGSRCGTLLPWHHDDGVIFRPPAQLPPDDGGGFPAWLTWTLAGVASVAATGVVLWQAGTFDEPAPGETRFQFTPPERPPPR